MWNAIKGSVKRAVEVVFWWPVNYIRRKFFLKKSISKAFEEGDIGAIKRHIELGENSQIMDRFGNNALHLAAHYDSSPELVNFFVERGVSLEARNNFGFTPLQASLEDNRYHLAAKLLSHGANVQTKDNQNRGLLHSLSRFHNFTEVNNIFEQLIQHDVQIEELDSRGLTPLHEAAKNNNHYLVELLVGKGSEVNKPANDGCAPLHYSAMHDNPRLHDFLLAQGSDINAMDNNGNSTLHKAAYSDNRNLIEKLLKAGANPDAKNIEGKTSSRLALDKQNIESNKLLLKVSKSNEQLQGNDLSVRGQDAPEAASRWVGRANQNNQDRNGRGDI